MKTASGTTLISNGQLIDGTGSAPVAVAALLIKDGLIEYAGPASDAMRTSFPIMFSRMLRAANSVRCRTEFPSLSKLNDSTTPPVKVPGMRRISSLGMLPDSAFWNVAGVSALHKAVATAS